MDSQLNYLSQPLYFICTTHLIILLIQIIVGFYGKSKFYKRHDSSGMSASILIPVCDENIIVLSNTINKCKHITGADAIIVLENSRNANIKKQVISLCHELGIRCISINNLGNKASAINYWIKHHCSDKYVAIFDADQQPDKTFLKETMCFLDSNSKLAIIQTPQYFRNENFNIISMMYSNMQKVFFSVIGNSRSRIGFSTCYGTNFVFRVEALKEVGLFDEAIVTEDSATAYRLYNSGYEILYVDKVLATGLAPITFSALNTQIKRYVIGNNQLLLRVLIDIISKPNFRNLFISGCFAHSSISYIVSAAWFILCILPVHNLLYSPIAIFLFLLFISLSVFVLKSGKALLGIIFGAILTPLHLMHMVNPFGYGNYFEVTEKVEQ